MIAYSASHSFIFTFRSPNPGEQWRHGAQGERWASRNDQWYLWSIKDPEEGALRSTSTYCQRRWWRIEPVPSHSTCSTSPTRSLKAHTIRVFVQPQRTTFWEVSDVKMYPCWRPDLSPSCSQRQSPSWTPVFTFLTAAVSRARKSTSCWTGIS